MRKQLLAQVRAKARPEHYPAPYAIIDLWSKHGARGAAAYEAEARSIADLMVGETSRNLVRVFFLQERLKDLGGKTQAAARSACTWSAPASWAATSPPGARSAA